MTRPYGEAGYRAAAELLRRRPEPCWKGCGRTATTLDHSPPLAAHCHVAGSGCCQLLPACAPCNYGGGARLGARRRWQPATASRSW
jgi:hypothetical protein